MRVALVHYWLVQMAGGEKVLEALCRLYPQADIFTHVVSHDRLSPLLQEHPITTTWLGKLPGVERYYQKLLPLMPHALEQLNLLDYDLVISCESGPAKGIVTRADSLHVCYCHTPMRYLWEEWASYLQESGIPTRLAMRMLLPRLRQWDYLSAQRPDRIIANSSTVAQRIRKYWRREANVVFPPVDVTSFQPKNVAGGDFYLCFGRVVGYKRFDLAVQACQKLERELVVIGDGPKLAQLKKMANSQVRFLGRCDDATVAAYFQQARALIFPGEEDFGIIPVEAQAAGLPVIAYQRGGATETVRDGTTGIFFKQQHVDSLCEAMLRFEASEQQFSPATLAAHAQHFCPERFAQEFSREVELGWQELAARSPKQT